MKPIKISENPGLYGLFYEWDEGKNETNLRKHGIDFENAGWILTQKDTVRSAVKHEPTISEYQHGFKLSDQKIKTLLSNSYEQREGVAPSSEYIDLTHSIITGHDPVRDRWIGKWDNKHWAIFTVFRLPRIRIISARRARKDEISKYESNNSSISEVNK